MTCALYVLLGRWQVRNSAQASFSYGEERNVNVQEVGKWIIAGVIKSRRMLLKSPRVS